MSPPLTPRALGDEGEVKSKIGVKRERDEEENEAKVCQCFNVETASALTSEVATAGQRGTDASTLQKVQPLANLITVILRALNHNPHIIILSLYFVKTILVNPTTSPTLGTPFRTLLASLILADTCLNDVTFSNASWAALVKLGGVEEGDGTAMEVVRQVKMEALRVMGFRIHVRAEVYATWLKAVTASLKGLF
ncbi:hypothetical protein HDU67_004692 [Dinochytrium kinnereticum]|nr:hypothetical protein HDU67_004692 [Dinochytrium kinnereticum]